MHPTTTQLRQDLITTFQPAINQYKITQAYNKSQLFQHNSAPVSPCVSRVDEWGREMNGQVFDLPCDSYALFIYNVWE